MSASTEALAPLLKWPGGKRWFIKTFHEIANQVNFNRLVEPFAGGMACSLGIQAPYVLANDINPHVINFYKHVQNGEFKIPSSFLLEKDYFYECRHRFNRLIEKKKQSSLEAAQLFWILNRLGYNGLCRFNKQGYYNVPFGAYTRVKKDFIWKDYQNLFHDWDFSTKDFTKLHLKCGDFVFCDPPYDSSFTQYTQEGFNFNRHIEMVEWLDEYHGPVIIMNHPTSRILDLYSAFGYELRLVEAPRAISCLKSGRQKKTEVVAFKNISWNDD